MAKKYCPDCNRFKAANKVLGEEVARLQIQIANLTMERDRDPLTGLYNRRHLGDVISMRYREVRTMSRDSLSLFFIDIDHFKMVNDTYGHEVGDQVLCAVAETLTKLTQNFIGTVGHGRHVIPDDHRQTKRWMDVARWGGEEIVIVGSDLADPEGVAESVRQAIEAIRFEDHPGLKVTASIGVATATVHSFIPKESLLKRADEAMYRAKETGRNRVVVAVIEEIGPNNTLSLVV